MEEEQQQKATDEGHMKEVQPSHHQGHVSGSQTAATGAQIRDVKCFFPALSPDYDW